MKNNLFKKLIIEWNSLATILTNSYTEIIAIYLIINGTWVIKCEGHTYMEQN